MDDEIGSIERCSLDGKNKTTIISDSMMTRNSRIVVDLIGGRIYYTIGNIIRSSTFEGNSTEEIQGYVNNDSRYKVTGIDVHGDFLYYKDNWSRYVYKTKTSGDKHDIAAYVYSDYGDVRTYNGKVIKDPCNAYRSINDANKRSTGFHADWTVDVPITDEMLKEDWYRVVSDNGEGMPTSPPGLKRCGTINPIWLKGSGPVKCPNDMSSETEHYPGCNPNFPKDRTSVEVKAVLTEDASFKIGDNDPTPSLIPIFKCEFEDKSNGIHIYSYDVYWYICANIVKKSSNLLFKNIHDAVVLKQSDWIGKYHMNMQPISHNYYYTVNEGESINITFTSTVPVGCIVSHNAIRSQSRQCDLNFYIVRPSYYTYESTCSNGVLKRDILFNADFCGFRLGNLNWKEKKTLEIYGYNDGLYNENNRIAYIKLSTSSNSTYNNIWKDFDMREIRVDVIDKDSTLKNRICQTYNDPHFRTFDGKYYDYMEVGEFVLYKNDIGPFWVHGLFTSCGYGLSGTSCLCGIAIRSKDSLFVLRTCEMISRKELHLLQQPVVTLTPCDESDMSINNTNNNYKIILPIGTEIKFSIARRFISVISIKPSVKDINTARGLCGVPSATKDPSDDFTHRENGPISNEQIFAESWRITDGMVKEQLFVEEPTFLKKGKAVDKHIIVVDNNEKNPNLRTYCACERQASSTNALDEFNSGDCNLTDSTEQCSDSSGSFCINKTLQTDMYTDYVDVPDEKFIESCVKDIEVAGDTTFLTDTVNAMVTSIITELVKTEKLYTQTSIDGSQTLLEYFSSSLCPNNCSDNGLCKSGICSCDERHIGEDCSYNTSSPPTGINVPFHGECKLRTRSCRAINIFGEFLTTSVWCKLRHFQILDNDLVYTPSEEHVLAEYRNPFMITLDLPTSRKKRSVDKSVLSEGYDISCSYDGQNFGKETSIIIYDDLKAKSGDEPDQNTTSSDKRIGTEDTVSELKSSIKKT
ncbi:unnamed protein product [Mytilus edulis]|uniref:VWFD domain-containing protein n=1 Tax=Mytilus edulis TaxID=6550 RepID=A0A8S3TBV2_MYTED|nr:unnamed protein product [Mytilus edulis]